jgi:5-(carboxyamino)imidazole ribonucleotide synthase
VSRPPAPIVPPATLGVLGGGQLGRYFVLAATVMGYRTFVLDPDPSAPAGQLASEHLVHAYDDEAALRRLAFDCDVVTTEFENPPAAALARLAELVPVAPSPEAVAIAQDRIAEKRFLADNGFPIGSYVVLDGDDPPGLEAVTEPTGIVKTARLGYDGKGQRTVQGTAQAVAAWAELGGVPCVVERRLELDTELSVIVGRTGDGRVEAWPVAENRHVDGILDLTIVPAAVPARLADRAVGLAMAIADALDYVGVLAVEMFVVQGELYVNELAPRPHNSGHWTLDGCSTSQFEQQVRAVCGLGLGPTTMTVPAIAMANLLGDLWSGGDPQWDVVLDDPHAKLHLYGKHEARPGRKMGHLTVTSEVSSAAAARAVELRAAARR